MQGIPACCMQLYAENPAPNPRPLTHWGGTSCDIYDTRTGEIREWSPRKTLIGGGDGLFVTESGLGTSGKEPMRHFVSAVWGATFALVSPAFAQVASDVPEAGQKQPVVVELFTSQGCASCPPADELLAELAAHEEVIPLALHVDYWDYIGWEDSFAKAQFTERQKSYARAVKSRLIYTPQMIVGGVDRVEGNAPDAVVNLIGKHLTERSTVRLTVERQGDMIVIRAMAEPPLTAPVDVQLVRYQPEAQVAIERGENAGRTVTYHNIVTEWTKLAEWPGVQPLEMTAAAPGSQPVVVILQDKGPAEVLAAARVE